MKRLLIIGLSLLLVIGAAYLLRGKFSASETFESAQISFSYPKSYQPQPVAEPPSQGPRILARLDAQDPIRTITLTYEKDAKTGATLTKQNFLDFLEANAETNLPRLYSAYDFAKEGVTRRQVSGVELSDLSFRYTAKDKKTRVFSTLLIIPIEKDGYYLKLESTDKKNLDSETGQLLSSLKIAR